MGQSDGEAGSERPQETARLEAELREARRNQDRYRAAQALTGIGAWEWSIGPDRIWWSEEMYRLLGVEPGSTQVDLAFYLRRLHPSQRESVSAALGEALRSGSSLEFRHRILLPDGSERVLLGRARVERGPDGGAVRMIGTAQDITQRRRVEEALKENEDRLRLLLTQAPAVLWSTDRDLRITFSRGGGLAALGMQNDQAVGLSLAEMLGSADPAYLPYGAHLRALEGHSTSYEYEWHGRDYATRIEPFRSDEGEIIGTLGIALDITERVQTQRTLEARERHFRTLIENVQDVITVLDERGTIRYESPAVERVLGYPAAERVGRNAFDYVHPEDVDRVRRTLLEALDDPGKPHTATLRVRHRDGTWRELEVVGTNLLQDPAVGGVVINSRDITERNRLETQLRQAQRLETVGKLAGGIAHDFNNLLTVIQGNAQMLLSDLAPDSTAHADAEEIERAARRAAELTQQLLIFSRRQVLQPQVLDLNQLVAGMDTVLRRLVREDVHLRLELAPGLAPVRVDPSQLHLVLVNLVVNAREAMPQGGTLTVQTRGTRFPASSGRTRDAVLLAVSDTGVGMPPEVRERAFEPFFTTKPAGEGPGLGLSTVYGIVSEAGGVTRIRSEPGAGTTVEVYLPAVAAAAEAGAPGGAAAEEGPSTILLVEDEDAVRAVARKALERAGYRVLALGDATEALRVVLEQGSRIDALVTDVVMPHMSGPELVARIHQERPSLRVLYISGYTEEAVVRRGIAQGTAELLGKPFSPLELVRRVRELLER